MKYDIQKDVTITTRGQLTLPLSVRKVVKLGIKRKVRVSVTGDGVVTVRQLPDVMSFFGALKGKIAHDPAEKQKSREALGRSAARRGR